MLKRGKKFPKGKPKTTNTVRIPEAMLNAITDFLGSEEAKKMGYRFKADVVTAAVRDLLNKYGFYEVPEVTPPLEHFNLNEHGVLILDRTLQPNRIIQVYFRPEGILCELCEGRCKHVEFALGIPKVQEILRKKGWKIE